ncbi:MAG: FkbM family methyltransferase [Alphaproteobacteria bacterium]
MISYAQNFEDVMLARVLEDTARGFYIDVGAMDPRVHSVTCHFYEQGWHGINIEPVPSHFARLVEARPRDINLNLALGEREEMRELFDVPDTGLASFRAHEPAAAEASPMPRISLLKTRVTTLAQVCADHAGDATIDFLKIDVEGWERQVIEGGDWRRFRPRVVVVEATRPNSPEPAWAEWEPHLLTQGYLFVWFDGLNRFYLREEEAALRRHFTVPPNVFDDFVPWDVVRLERERDSAAAEHARLSESHLRLVAEHERLAEEHAGTQAALAGETAERMARERELAAVHNSHSWRITAPLRWLSQHLGSRGRGPH